MSAPDDRLLRPSPAETPAPDERLGRPSTAEAPAPDDPPAEADFAITSPETAVWVVAGGGCLPLAFIPSAPTEGALLIYGQRMSYRTSGDEMALLGAWESDGYGLVARPCRTTLRVGPGATLGGADVFADEASCLANKATALPLDDSPDATMKRCRGESVAVTTDEVVCGENDRHLVLAGKEGCISVVLRALSE
jgi:hypothetical protein